jgi:nucleoid-associated protein YgaU
LGRLVTGLGALSVLVGLTVGLPLLLRYATEIMLPHGWTPPADLPDALMSPDDGSLFAQAVIGTGWCAWALFSILVAWEIGRRLLGRQPHIRARIRSPQGVAGFLVAAAAALATSPVSSAQAAALPVVAADSDPRPDNDQAPPEGETTRPGYRLHLVERGQGLLDLQELYGVAWQRIAEANYGMEQPEGGRVEPGRTVIYSGWQLRIPTTPTPTMPVAYVSEQPEEADPDQQPVYEVASGDWMWHIAGRYLGDEERYREIAAINPQLVQRYGDKFPDHIQPGDRLTLPSDVHDRGERRHATGALITVAPPREQEPAPPDDEPVEPPEPPPPPAQPPTPATPTPTPTSSGAPSSATPVSPTSQTGEPGAPDDQADTPDDHSRPGARVPVAFGAALITATLAATAAVKLRRRGTSGDPRVARRGHRPGHRPRHVDKGTVEQALHAAAQPLDVDPGTSTRAPWSRLCTRPRSRWTSTGSTPRCGCWPPVSPIAPAPYRTSSASTSRTATSTSCSPTPTNSRHHPGTPTAHSGPSPAANSSHRRQAAPWPTTPAPQPASTCCSTWNGSAACPSPATRTPAGTCCATWPPSWP